jgi:hypothetical protein
MKHFEAVVRDRRVFALTPVDRWVMFPSFLGS